MPEEIKKAVPKKPVKKTTSSRTKSSSTTKPKTTKSTPKKASTSGSKTTTKTTSTSKKPVAKNTTKKTTTSKPKTTSPKPKTVPKEVKKDSKSSVLGSGDVKTVKKTTNKTKTTTRKKTPPRVKKQEELTTLEVLEQKIEGKEIVEKKPLGKTFYLFFSLIFYSISFVYIHLVYFDQGDLLQSALFAFAALFIAFVLILFNVHKLILGFFVLPLRRLVKQARQEVNKEIFFSVGKNKVQTALNKYRTIFTFVIYFLIFGLLIYSNVRDYLETDDTVMQLINGIITTELVFLIIICSWQYLFNIIPEILDKSIDAKNGYILALSAFVMVIYIIFNMFSVEYLSEIMIFILIIGFIALLGVNLNMIVGEINIFSNLQKKHDKSVTRVVFAVFFTFHIYVILYASVVAYSIYIWDNDSFSFSSETLETVIVDTVYDNHFNSIDSENIYYFDGINYTPVTGVYDQDGNLINNYLDSSNTPVRPVYSDTDIEIWGYYNALGEPLDQLFINDHTMCDVNTVFYYEDNLACLTTQYKDHEYGVFLYWTVISVSTIGYGDVSPSTNYPIAMAWGGFLGIYGLTFFALSISYVSNIAMEGRTSRKEDL